MKMIASVLVAACLLGLTASAPQSQNCAHSGCNQNNVGNLGGQHQPQHGGQHQQPGHGSQHHQGVNIPGVHIAGAHIPGTHIPGVHIAGAHIPGTNLPGAHVPAPHQETSHHHQPSQQLRQPSPQHHDPSHSQSSISQNCVGSHCSQNNFLRRKREIVDAINSLTEDVLKAEKVERRKREIVDKLLEEARKIAQEEAALEEVNSLGGGRDVQEELTDKKRDIISALVNESA
eukprot:TRINITY_DN891_c0_g1_i2.p1 TRINITY_DN891_c0_g1~~TRINITY_DN891_c0_g1_i2.p1  ORF type:complete len:231 (-),score=67.49 TRINITY_DN891_c0_g1_i2:70-762(-)